MRPKMFRQMATLHKRLSPNLAQYRQTVCHRCAFKSVSSK
jgi:hypothetical protein